MRIIDTFAHRLNYALTIRNMKPIELSKRTGIAKPQISAYMNNKYEPKQKGIKAMADVLDVNPIWLMGYDEEMENSVAQKMRIALDMDDYEPPTEEQLDKIRTMVSIILDKKKYND